MLTVIVTTVVLLAYPFGGRRVAAQSLCSENPFVSLRPSGGSGSSVDCSLYSDDEGNCWNQPDCYYFSDNSQLPVECASLPVYWPNLDQTMTVTVGNADSPVTIVGGDANGPSAKYACIPVLLSSTTMCYDSMNVYPDNLYVVLFGVPRGLDVLKIDVGTQLTKSKYISMSVLALNAESPDPLGACSIKSLATTASLSLDSSQEYVIAVRLKMFANQTNIDGEKVSITIASPSDIWATGDGKPVPEPPGYTCPLNWAEAIETPCTENTVVCRYTYRYVGCTYDELNCIEQYNCDCQSFLDTWRCWGKNEVNCPDDAPTRDLLGQSCNPRAKLPEDPNPPPAVCPPTIEEAYDMPCDKERLPRCEYDHKWHGCSSEGDLTCQATGSCVCQGKWYCREVQPYCKFPPATPIPLVGTSCDPEDD